MRRLNGTQSASNVEDALRKYDAISRKFPNDYCQRKLPSHKYFRKAAGSSNIAEALSLSLSSALPPVRRAGVENGVYGQPSMNRPHSGGQRVVRVRRLARPVDTVKRHCSALK